MALTPYAFSGAASSVLQQINKPPLSSNIGPGSDLYTNLYTATYSLGIPLVSGLSGLVYFSQGNLFSNIDEVVYVTPNCYLAANVELSGNIKIDGVVSTNRGTFYNGAAITPGPLTISGSFSKFAGLFAITKTGNPNLVPAYGIVGQVATDAAFGVQVLSNSQSRFQIAAGGSVSWGPGNVSTDTNLYRSGAGTLSTDGALVIGGTLITAGQQTNFPTITVNPGPLTVSGAASNFASLAGLTNTAIGPADSPIGFIGAAASDKILGTKVTGDTNPRFRILTDGTLQWGPGTAATDTTLNRSGLGTLNTTGTLTVGGLMFAGTKRIAGLDTNVNDIQFKGVPAAGAVGQVADAGHVHLLVAQATIFLDPAAADYETMPRQHVTNDVALTTSSALYMHSIALPSLQPVNYISFQVGAQTAVSVTHGYYLITDQNRIVRAISADQGSSTLWGTANTTVRLTLSPGYTVPSAGLYYIGLSITGSTLPSLATRNNLVAGMADIPPVLYGRSDIDITPPAVGSTISALNSGNGFNIYGFTAH